MARRRKVLPARKPRNESRDDDALLLRSAETLGRMIGALQRQLDDATRRLTGNGARGAATNGPTQRSGGSSDTSATSKKKSAPKRSATKAAVIATQKRRARARSTRRAAKPR